MTNCHQCEAELKGAKTCPNCGWQAPVQHTRLRSKFWEMVGFWALMVGVCGGCGYLAYAGVGAFTGVGPLAKSPILRGIVIGVVVLYAMATMIRARRRR